MRNFSFGSVSATLWGFLLYFWLGAETLASNCLLHPPAKTNLKHSILLPPKKTLTTPPLKQSKQRSKRAFGNLQAVAFSQGEKAGQHSHRPGFRGSSRNSFENEKIKPQTGFLALGPNTAPRPKGPKGTRPAGLLACFNLRYKSYSFCTLLV